jgi:hypothetical protein
MEGKISPLLASRR